MEERLKSASSSKVLLHICCGPCAIMPIKKFLDEDFEVIGWFMNPNIQPLAEYLKRREGAGQVAEKLGIKIIYDDVWDIKTWLKDNLHLVNDPQRCDICCTNRLEAAAKKASELDMPFFSTTLLYSRYQPHEIIKNKGMSLNCGSKFLYHDFRQYWQDGINISKEWGIYRQPYCGCIFSEAERYTKKLNNLRQQINKSNVLNQ